VFIFPWEGITLIGTTDVDYENPLDEEPRISSTEFVYLMEAVNSQFASLNLNKDDVLTTFAGVRPVIGTGKVDPSKESRDHVLWEEEGLLTITGGKLTTFRLIALDVLKAVRERLPQMAKIDKKRPVLDPIDADLSEIAMLDEEAQRRLLGRYGTDAIDLVKAATDGELEAIPGTKALWAELRWAARAEGVVHLDDLLLRRVRLGLLTDEGGLPIIDRVRAIVQPELGWDDERWAQEVQRYAELWHSCYSVPPGISEVAGEGLIELKEAIAPSDEPLEIDGEGPILLWEPRLDESGSGSRRYVWLLLILMLVLLLLQRRRGEAKTYA
jgi:glycerol-3-phosphate dehydrogenase